MGRLTQQPNRATLRSDPMQAVRYTVENGGGNAAVFYDRPVSPSG